MVHSHDFYCTWTVADAKEVFNLYDDEGDGKIDGTQIGSVCRALGLKPTNAMVHKAAGKEYKKLGEWLQIFTDIYFTELLNVFRI